MAYDPGAIDATLAAAVGDEPGLIAELRLAFVESVERTLATLDGKSSSQDWRTATLRLKGLAASFGAVRLMALAAKASEAVPNEQRILQRLRRASDRL